MMHVAQMVNALRVGGAEKLLVTFAGVAQRRGYPCTIITLRRNSPEIQALVERLGARVVEFPDRKLVAPGRFLELVRFFREERFDVVHTHLTMANILGALAGSVTGTPIVTSLHNVQMRSQSHWFHGRLESWLLHHRVGGIVAVGWDTAEAHETRVGDQKIRVIPNAVDIPPSLPAADKQAARAGLLGLNSAGPLLIYVGRLEPQKAVADLIHAFALVSASHPDVHLAIVGDGSLRQELAALIDSRGLARRISLLGLRHDVPRLLAAADIYVSAAHWEGLPVATLEAMAAALPVVVTAVGDVPRVVPPAAGELVPPGQPEAFAAALTPLLANPDRRLACGTAARAHVTDHFSADLWFDRLLNLYRELSPRPASPTSEALSR